MKNILKKILNNKKSKKVGKKKTKTVKKLIKIKKVSKAIKIKKVAKELNDKFTKTKNDSFGYQFISIQSTPFVEKFAGFWILRDIELLS